MSGDPTEELRRRAAQLARPPAPTADTELVDALAFAVDGSRYLLPATSVSETVAVRRLQRIPGARPPLLGACTVRGRLLPVVDLRLVIGLPATPEPVTRVVVLADAQRPSLALAADQVDRLVRVRREALEPAGGDARCTHGTTHDGELLLDADALLDLPSFFDTWSET